MSGGREGAFTAGLAIDSADWVPRPRWSTSPPSRRPPARWRHWPRAVVGGIRHGVGNQAPRKLNVDWKAISDDFAVRISIISIYNCFVRFFFRPKILGRIDIDYIYLPYISFGPKVNWFIMIWLCAEFVLFSPSPASFFFGQGNNMHYHPYGMRVLPYRAYGAPVYIMFVPSRTFTPNATNPLANDPPARTALLAPEGRPNRSGCHIKEFPL